MVEPEKPQMTSQYGACAHIPVSNTYCLSTATMILERASLLRYTYIVCLVVW